VIQGSISPIIGTKGIHGNVFDFQGSTDKRRFRTSDIKRCLNKFENTFL
jgi:hypothetical protein